MTVPRNLPFHAFAQDMRTDHVRDELRTDWSMVVLYRWPGVALAWLLARAGIGPVGATAIGFVLALTLPIQAMWLPMAWATWAVALTAALFQALDCADGTLARTTGRSSVLGADLDYFAGMAQWPLLYSAIGLLADRTFETGFAWTALGAGAGAARLLARLVREQVAVRSAQAAGDSRPMGLLQMPAVFLAGISGLIPFLALFGDWLGVAVWCLMVYSLLDIGEGLLPLLRRDYGRTSD